MATEREYRGRKDLALFPFQCSLTHRFGRGIAFTYPHPPAVHGVFFDPPFRAGEESPILWKSAALPFLPLDKQRKKQNRDREKKKRVSRLLCAGIGNRIPDASGEILVGGCGGELGGGEGMGLGIVWLVFFLFFPRADFFAAYSSQLCQAAWG